MTDQFPDATKKVLSPAAQTVLDAYNEAYESDRHAVAAALRAVADKVAPFPGRYPMNEYMEGLKDARQYVRREILTIADELEGVTYGTYRCELEAR